MAHQLLKRGKRDALLVAAFYPHFSQIDTELAQPVEARMLSRLASLSSPPEKEVLI
jgi:hypothetical protein